ncbi:MAG: DUF4258 domain-containing protein [Burkholderiales bacterium]
MDYVIGPHAAFEMARRGLDAEIIRRVLVDPEQEVEVREGRVIFQSRVGLGKPGRTYLVRVVVDVDRWPAEVVTVYRTTKISKYWRR